MADDPRREAPAPVFTESVPAQYGGLSAIASASAPFIYFDTVSNFGFNAGIANATLEATRFISTSDNVLHDRVIVAHLRMSLAAAVALRAALDGVILAATPKPPGEAH